LTRDFFAGSARALIQHHRDCIVALALACGVFFLYARTLVPSVLDGDQGEYQFIAAALGIPHPSGFPLYVLIGHLWSYLPLGALAFRMNLLSAFFGALTIGALFIALRRQHIHSLAAIWGALTLAVIPQFWEYATVAAVYRLHTFLIVLLFLGLAEWERTRRAQWLWLSAFAFGLDLANHLTISLFVPAIIVFVLLVVGRAFFAHARVFAISALFLLLPLVLYFYFPLRAQQLIADEFVVPGFRSAVARGIVSPFYPNSPEGLLNFITGAAFLGNIPGNAQWQWNSFPGDWLALNLQIVNPPIVIAALIGLIVLARQRAKIALWLALVIATLQFLALQYSYANLAAIGQFSSYYREYYLPSFIALMICATFGAEWIARCIINARSKIIAACALIGFAICLLVPMFDLVARRSTALVARSSEVEAQWRAIKKFAPEPNAALVAHWGDLTPLWYYQHAENWRRDVIALYPPMDETIDAWIATGKPAYLAGPLLDWATNVVEKYRLTPWGALVRVSDPAFVPVSPFAQNANWTFTSERPIIRALGFEVAPARVRAGDSLDVAIFWESLVNISLDDTLLYLSFANQDASKQSFTLVVNWMPGGKLIRGQRALGIYRFAIPPDLAPGEYALRATVYSIRAARNLNCNAEPVLASITIE
jgi:hypothetical protein